MWRRVVHQGAAVVTGRSSSSAYRHHHSPRGAAVFANQIMMREKSTSSVHQRAVQALGMLKDVSKQTTDPKTTDEEKGASTSTTTTTTATPKTVDSSSKPVDNNIQKAGMIQLNADVAFEAATTSNNNNNNDKMQKEQKDNNTATTEEPNNAADKDDDMSPFKDEKAINGPASSAMEEPFLPPFVSGQLHEFAPKIVVVGVGGAGGNAINNMIAKELQGVDFCALNTDAQHLSTTLTDQRLQLGAELTRGLGCGANPDAGRMAAEECREEIESLLGGAHMVFITAGMGGGTGTGAAPVIAEICYQRGILTVAVVTMPFAFEGTHRRRLAMEGIGRMQDVVDTLIVIPNQNLFSLATPDTSFVDAFRMADDVLLGGVKSITDLMTSPGLINLDFADVQSVMHGMGNALLGTGVASGEDRAIEAAQEALDNPLLSCDYDISTAKGMLVNITGGKDMTLFEVDKAAQIVTEKVKDAHANIIFGSAYEENLDGSMRVTVVATGIEGSKAE